MQPVLNLLVTLNEHYLPYLRVMLTSLLYANPQCRCEVYILHRSIPPQAIRQLQEALGEGCRLHDVPARGIGLEDAPTTERYPQEIYYRIFAARYLPDTLERVLYLDPDVIVNGPLQPLYELPMEQYFFAAASHTGPLLQRVNTLRLDMEENSPYINSGVMLMNLQRLRREQDPQEVFRFIQKHKKQLMLPDQDVISGLYGSRILALDAFRYNMTERLFQLHAHLEKDLTLDWVRKNAVIIHYCGRNKPWRENYLGQLDVFYREAAARAGVPVVAKEP